MVTSPNRILSDDLRHLERELNEVRERIHLLSNGQSLYRSHIYRESFETREQALVFLMAEEMQRADDLRYLRGLSTYDELERAVFRSGLWAQQRTEFFMRYSSPQENFSKEECETLNAFREAK